MHCVLQKVLVASLLGLSRAGSFNGRAGQHTYDLYDYDYTYGDSSFEYDDTQTSRTPSPEVTKGPRGTIGSTFPEKNLKPHVILDDSNNYDYTYGDPDFGYDYEHDLSQARPSSEAPAASKETFSGTKTRTLRPHVVLDDSYNYDYTYGDPNFDYDYEHDLSQPREDDDHSEDPSSSSSEEDEDEDEEEDDHMTPSPPPKGKVSPIVSALIEWVIKNLRDAQVMKNQVIETRDQIRAKWQTTKHSLEMIWKALQAAAVKFGKEAEEGLRYCLVKFKDAGHVIKGESLEVLYKLKSKLNEGNELAVSFFRLLGQKVEKLKEKYGTQLGHEDFRLSSYTDGTDQVPNLFEDEEVLQRLRAMVEADVLQREEVELLLTAAAEQTQRATGNEIQRKEPL